MACPQSHSGLIPGTFLCARKPRSPIFSVLILIIKELSPLLAPSCSLQRCRRSLSRCAGVRRSGGTFRLYSSHCCCHVLWKYRCRSVLGLALWSGCRRAVAAACWRTCFAHLFFFSPGVAW